MQTASLTLGLICALILASNVAAYDQYVAVLNGRNTVPDVINSTATGVFSLAVDTDNQIAYYTFR